MTREEAIERIKMILEEATANEDAVSYVTSDDTDALDMSINALEQQSILNKIRAVIMDTGAYEQEVNYCLSIIDKYKTEMQEVNDNGNSKK